MSEDIRWRQRFHNFNLALKQLGFGCDLLSHRKLSILEEQGLIQAFEYTHELAWNLLKDYLSGYGGIIGLIGSRDTTRESFKSGLITNGELWMEMITSRNMSSHTYNEATASKLVSVIPQYYQEFLKLQTKFNTIELNS